MCVATLDSKHTKGASVADITDSNSRAIDLRIQVSDIQPDDAGVFA